MGRRVHNLRDKIAVYLTVAKLDYGISKTAEIRQSADRGGNGNRSYRTRQDTTSRSSSSIKKPVHASPRPGVLHRYLGSAASIFSPSRQHRSKLQEASSRRSLPLVVELCHVRKVICTSDDFIANISSSTKNQGVCSFLQFYSPG